MALRAGIVWLLDAHEDLRTLEAWVLRQGGYEVLEFASASALVHRLDAPVRPSVLLVDAWDTRSAEETIAARVGVERIIALVSSCDEAETWRRLGAARVIPKGARGDALLTAVEDLVAAGDPRGRGRRDDGGELGHGAGRDRFRGD